MVYRYWRDSCQRRVPATGEVSYKVGYTDPQHFISLANLRLQNLERTMVYGNKIKLSEIGK